MSRSLIWKMPVAWTWAKVRGEGELAEGMAMVWSTTFRLFVAQFGGIGFGSATKVDPELFQEAYTSKLGLVRIFKASFFSSRVFLAVVTDCLG